MKKHALLITAIISFIAMPAYSHHGDHEGKFRNARQRFEKIDQDGDGFSPKMNYWPRIKIVLKKCL